MTPRLTIQEDSAPKSKIVEFLMLLKSGHSFTNREIAAQLGVNENYLSRVSNGRAEGSEQLLAGLRLLLELETLKKEVIELRSGQAALRKFMGQPEVIPVKYPELLDQPEVINEDPAPATVDEKIKLEAMRQAELGQKGASPKAK